MKKLTSASVILGVVLGAAAALLAGSWMVWLGLGVAIGVALGASRARRLLLAETCEGQQAKS